MSENDLPLLLAEELLLLFLDDETGAMTVSGVGPDYALGGAVLLELVLAEQAHLGEREGMLFKRAHVEVVRAAATPSDPVLVDALATIAKKPRTAQELVPALAKGLRQRLLERLVAREVLRAEKGRVLFFPVDRWPTVDRAVESGTRQRLEGVLLHDHRPDPRTGALVALLSAVDQAHRVLGPLDRHTRAEVKARAKQVAEGAWAAQAVRKAVQAVEAATAGAMVAVMAASTASTSS